MKRLMVCAAGMLSAVTLVAATGCIAVVFAAGAAVGVSGAVCIHGESRTSLAGSLPRVRDAATAVLQKMGNGVSTEGAGDIESTLTSYTRDGRKITIEREIAFQWSDRDPRPRRFLGRPRHLAANPAGC